MCLQQPATAENIPSIILHVPCYQTSLTVSQYNGIIHYRHACYSECKNRLVHIAESSHVSPYNSTLHTQSMGLCHLKRCGNKQGLRIQILFFILPGFTLYLCFSPSLALWSAGCPAFMVLCHHRMSFCHAFLITSKQRQGPPRRLKHNIIKNSSENIYHGDSLANTGLSWACGCCAHRGFLPCLPFLLTTPRHEYTTSRGMEAAAPWHSQPIQKEMTLWESTITAKIPKPLFWDSSYICC